MKPRAQLWECPRCRRRVETPIACSGVWCKCDAFDKRGRTIGKVAMTLIWNKGDGPMPEVVTEGV